jgi:cobalamin biosynthesis protein CobD/CbiB
MRTYASKIYVIVMKRIITWVQGLLKDEKGTPSSKRFVGIICALSLCVALFINLFTEHPVDGNLVNSVALLAFGGLGLSSIDKFTAAKKQVIEATDKIEE